MFGISPQFQSRLGPLAGRLNQPAQPAAAQPMDLSKMGSLPSGGDVRTGLSKLGFGGPPAAPGGAPPVSMPGMPPQMPPISSYNPAAMTTGLPSSAAAGVGDAAAGAGADVAAAGPDAAAAGGFDITQILAFLGL